MVEAVVSFAAQRLRDLLIQEAVSLYGIHNQVNQLQTELIRMQCFLQDAEAKQATDERVRNWVAEIRDIAYDSEDVIDTFILKVAFRDGGGNIGGVLNSFIKMFHLYNVGKEIQAILTKVQDISVSRKMYGIQNVGASSSSVIEKDIWLQKQLGESYPDIMDDDVIGLDDHIWTLVSELIKEEEERRVVSIIGVGGLGKTTLAKKVYNHHVLKTHFDCFAWTFISQQCHRSDVLKEILKKVGAYIVQETEMNEKDLVAELHTFLDGKRYFVVLDNIWRVEDWDVFCPAFPNGKMGSKVLLTTRNKEVASIADPWSLHLEPLCLTEDESWELLRKKAFPKNMTSINCSLVDLEKLGREMARSCGCLPLGIIVLGGLLATKKPVISEWMDVYKHIDSYMNKGGNGVTAILALSYDDLPYDLKPCFLYLCLFPEDFEISRKKLVQLWIAEGFIPQQTGQVTMEDVGEQQFAELTQRCIVQIGKKSMISGRVQTCRMHDLMRDLCMLKAREANFLDISVGCQGNNAMTSSSNIAAAFPSYNRLRRHAIHNSQQGMRYVSLENLTSQLRTLSIMDTRDNYSVGFDHSILKVHYQNIKLLRVLDLDGVSIARYDVMLTTKEIGKLIHLVYLRMTNMEDGLVSPSICNLRNLRTLHLRRCTGTFLNTTWNTEQLRHLCLFDQATSCGTGNWRMGTLTNIESLYWIHGGKWIDEGDLEKMTSLRKLGIRRLTTSQAKVVLESNIVINKSFDSHLRSLSLDMYGVDLNPFPNLEPLSNSYHLLKLDLSGRIETTMFPRFSPNLIKLTLTSSKLHQDPMEVLQDLPNLNYLFLGSDSYIGNEMVCSSKGGFPKLKILKFFYLSNLVVWRIEEGAMPSLKHLNLNCCLEMMFVKGLRFVTSVEELELHGMRKEFVARISKGGEDRCEVQHIPSIKTVGGVFTFIQPGGPMNWHQANGFL